MLHYTHFIIQRIFNYTMATDTVRFQLVLPRWLRDEVLAHANAKGISMSEFIKDSLKEEIASERKSESNS